jgi:hypothetical protein
MKDKIFFDNDIIFDISIERDESLKNVVNDAVELINADIGHRHPHLRR